MATLQARKALVNDAVFSFCYACRTDSSHWAMPIFGAAKSCDGWKPGELDHSLLIPFIAYALSKQPNYIKSMRHIILMAAWLRSFTDVERTYAIYLMDKYYGISNRTTCSDQSDIPRYCNEGLSSSPELQECY